MFSRILILTLLSFEFVFSQQMKLSYHELIALTLKNNLTIKTYQEKLKQAEYKEKEIFYGTLPQLKFTGRYSRLSKVDPFVIQLPFVPGSPEIRVYEPLIDNYYTRLSLDFPLFTGLRQRNSVKAQEKFVDASESEIKAAINDILYKSKELYLKLYFANQILKIIEANIQYLDEQKKIAENFYQNGLLHKNDVLKLDIASTQARIKLSDQKNLINKLNLSLCQILNLDLTTEIIPVINLEDLYSKASKLEILEQEEFNKPEIEALQNVIKANQYLKSAALGSFLPNLFLNAGYDYAKPNTKYFPILNKWKYTWDVNLIFQFTLWDWMLPKYRLQQIDAQINQLEFQLNQLKTKISADQKEVLNKLKVEKDKISLYEKELQFASENLRIVENKFNQGLATSTDILEANKLKLEADVHLEEAKVNYILMVEELKKLNGQY